jgi:hypothetical protein
LFTVGVPENTKSVLPAPLVALNVTVYPFFDVGVPEIVTLLVVVDHDIPEGKDPPDIENIAAGDDMTATVCEPYTPYVKFENEPFHTGLGR